MCWLQTCERPGLGCKNKPHNGHASSKPRLSGSFFSSQRHVMHWNKSTFNQVKTNNERIRRKCCFFSNANFPTIRRINKSSIINEKRCMWIHSMNESDNGHAVVSNSKPLIAWKCDKNTSLRIRNVLFWTLSHPWMKWFCVSLMSNAVTRTIFWQNEIELIESALSFKHSENHFYVFAIFSYAHKH